MRNRSLAFIALVFLFIAPSAGARDDRREPRSERRAAITRTVWREGDNICAVTTRDGANGPGCFSGRCVNVKTGRVTYFAGCGD